MPGQFSDFYNSLDADSSKRGKQFEHFVKWFLKADPEWATQVDQVWLWEEWPQRWGADCGVDLVFQHKNGEHWAVQAKCYSPDYDITKHDVDKFLSESNRPLIQHRLLIATTDRIGNNARQVCDAQDKPVIRFLLSDFEKSSLDYPANLGELPQAKRKPRPTPRDHQIEARAAVVQGLQSVDRGQLIMACGTGKTYVTLWIKEALNAQRTLVLVPSLGLLSQLLREWTFAAETPFEVLCVCSDQTVGSKGNDEAIHSVADLAFPVTSDAEEVKRFLSGAGNRVVFSTYQSSSVIAAAQADVTIPAFDLAVADEAHRCTGKVSGEFTTILDNAQIRSAKRLFATATPRTYSSNVKKAAEERGVEVVGMDSAALFGEVLYALPFGKAIEAKLLTDYRVVIIGVDDPTIAQWIAKRELVSLACTETQSRAATHSPLPPPGEGWDEGGQDKFHQQEKQLNQLRETDSESLAAQIGLLKAIKDYDLKRIISFHSRVNRAEAFTTDMQNTMAWISDEHRPSGTLRTDFVSGNMSANKRKIKLDQLKALGPDERGVLSNARCLSEGVDVPSLDGVAFIDPRSSQVDIIQAVGRAIRLSPDKKAGTIVLPVFLKAGEDAASTIEASNFKPIWDVLNALKAHDDVLADELDQIRTEMGRKTDADISADILRKIKIDLPATVGENFGSALSTYLVERVTESWNFWFGLLVAYANREGSAKVPHDYKTADGYRLSQWISHQRRAKDNIPLKRQSQLESLPGWSWDALSDKWEEGFHYLKEFVDKEGHANVPKRYKSADGYPVGNWVINQRVQKDKFSPERKARLEALGWGDLLNSFCMAPERKNRLEALPGWVWVARTNDWDECFRYLKEFTDREGHARVPTQYKTANGCNLGSWVIHQRTKKDTLAPEQKTLLETLAGWNWAEKAEFKQLQDDEWVNYLKDFVEREGHAKVPSDYKTADGYRLGTWVMQQRTKKDSLSPELKILLESLIAWSWDTHADNWDDKFRYLTVFVEREGHAKVPSDYKTADGYRLGTWVMQQRSKKDSLSSERKTLLESLPGWSWNTHADNWSKKFRYLTEFVELEGHAKVPSDYKTADGYRLGTWVMQQRSKKDSLSSERKTLLESLVAWSWDAHADNWDEKFRYLAEFVEREGHAKVPSDYKMADGYRLGTWVAAQKRKKDSMKTERKTQLEALPSWCWDIFSEIWEEGFSYLKEFADREGHTNVPYDYKTENGYLVSRWIGKQQQKKYNLPPERKARLEALPGWVWRVNK